MMRKYGVKKEVLPEYAGKSKKTDSLSSLKLEEASW